MEFIFMILGILKIILIVILSIFGITLPLIAIVLLVPFKYTLQGDFYDGQKVKAKINWLFKFLQINYFYTESSREIIVKILGIKILRKKHDEASDDSDSDEAKPKRKKKGKKTRRKDKKKKENSSYKSIKTASKNIEDEKIVSKKNAKNISKEQTSDVSEGTKPTDGSPEEFIEDVGEKIYEEKETIIDTIKEIYDKLKFVYEYADTKIIFKLTFTLLKEWYRKLKPDIVKIYGELGFENPATTGQSLGYISIFMVLTGLDIKLKPNFEKAIMDITLFIKGRFMLWYFIWPLLKYILKKPIWKLIKIIFFRKEERNE